MRAPAMFALLAPMGAALWLPHTRDNASLDTADGTCCCYERKQPMCKCSFFLPTTVIHPGKVECLDALHIKGAVGGKCPAVTIDEDGFFEKSAFGQSSMGSNEDTVEDEKWVFSHTNFLGLRQFGYCKPIEATEINDEDIEGSISGVPLYSTLKHCKGGKYTWAIEQSKTLFKGKGTLPLGTLPRKIFEARCNADAIVESAKAKFGETKITQPIQDTLRNWACINTKPFIKRRKFVENLVNGLPSDGSM
mmetsp:Transcript_52534/g.147971  ORF Transcript_52534/g.147971 Transcript_52534/m.147971 type:complete len:249 (-) Transcript_52534:41-787(-)